MLQLSKQINQVKGKKKYDSLMTEHERRVNDKDIEAYENQDFQILSSKLPGFEEQKPQSKFLKKHLGQNRSLQMDPHTRSQFALAAQNYLMSPERVDRSLVDEVRKNMESPEALKYRSNTGNK